MSNLQLRDALQSNQMSRRLQDRIWQRILNGFQNNNSSTDNVLRDDNDLREPLLAEIGEQDVTQATLEEPFIGIGSTQPARRETARSISSYPPIQPAGDTCEIADEPFVAVAIPLESSEVPLVVAPVTASAERECKVCMARPIDTVVLPCRHSVMCSECAHEVRSSQGNRCPICRTMIDMVRIGDYDSEFVSFADTIVNRAGRRLGQSAEHVFEGMYERVKALLLIGLFCLATSVVFIFMSFQILGTVLLILSFFIGYLPWFLVTVRRFENPRPEDGEHHKLFPPEDFRNPCFLLIKSIFLLVLLPLALVTFLIPYVCYASMLRPFARIGLPCFARISLRLIIDMFWYTWVGFAWVRMGFVFGLRQFAKCMGLVCECMAYSVEALHARVCSPVAWAIRSYICNPLTDACIWTFDRVLVPTMRSLANGVAVFKTGVYANVLVPCFSASVKIAQALQSNVLIPAKACLMSSVRSLYGMAIMLCDASARVAVSVAKLIHSYAIRPVVGGVIWFCNFCKMGVVATATNAYRFVILPLGKCVASLGMGAYHYVAVPFGRFVCYACAQFCVCLRFCAAASTCCLAGAASMFYKYVLYPIGYSVSVVLYVCGLAAKKTCRALITCVRSVVQALGQLCKVVAQGIAMFAVLLYANIIAPIGKGLAICIQSIGRGVVACSGMIANLGSLVYNSILAPIGELLKRLGLLIWELVSIVGSVIFKMLQTMGSVLFGVGVSIAFAVRAVGKAVAQSFMSVANSIGSALERVFGR